MPHKRVLTPFLLAALLLAGFAAFYFKRGADPSDQDRSGRSASSEPASDPRLTFATPYRNVRPEVKYVGDGACAGCHETVSQSYAQHSMGNSLAPVASPAEQSRYERTARFSFEAAGLHYQVERRGRQIFHQEAAKDESGKTIVQREAEVHFAVGSGKRGVSYLLDQDGFLFQSPITWYPQKGVWDLSPGYSANNQHFGRPIIADCLFCHSNRATPQPLTSNRYQPPIFHGHAIGCERCHGPGELHVQRRLNDADADEADYTIVNPGRLEHSLREAVCEQCHLQGEQRVVRRGRESFDFRPGLPLYLFLSDFVKPQPDKDNPKFVGTVEQMHASLCYQRSKGREKLGCISCHDPHELPSAERKSAYYRARCLTCHEKNGCTLAEEIRRNKVKDDSCVACHMPQTGSDIRHTSITDHSIPRQASKRLDKAAPASQHLRLVHFHHELVDVNDPESERDLGVALVDFTEKHADEAARNLAKSALPFLEQAAERDPADLPVLEARGTALWLTGRPEEALASYQSALAKAPDMEGALFMAATLARRMGKQDLADAYSQRLINVNPWRSQYLLLRAGIDAQARRWNSATDLCRRALQLEPTNLAARRLLIVCHAQAGEKEKARAEFDIFLAMTPAAKHEALRRWFAQQVP